MDKKDTNKKEEISVDNELYSVSEHDAKYGVYNHYRWEAQKWEALLKKDALIDNTKEGRIFVGYDSQKTDLDSEALVTIAKSVCDNSEIKRVLFLDYATCKAKVVELNSINENLNLQIHNSDIDNVIKRNGEAEATPNCAIISEKSELH